MKEPVILDLFMKVALVVIGAMFSFIAAICLWGIQKLATTLFANTQSNLAISHEMTAIKVEIAHLKRYVEKTDKNEKDINNFYNRLERVEEKTKEL